MARPQFSGLTESRNEEAERNGNTDTNFFTIQDQADGTQAGYDLVVNDGGDPMYLIDVAVALTKNFSQSVRSTVSIEDEQGNAVYKSSRNPPNTSWAFEVPPKIPPGYTARIQTLNNSGGLLTYDVNATWRPE